MTSSSGAGSRVVVLTRDAEARRLISAELEAAGFSTVIVESTDGAIDRVAAMDVAVAIVDLTLPRLDLGKVAQALRTAGNCPVVCLTAQGDRESGAAAIEAIADDFVERPIAPRVLIARVKAALRRQAAASGRQEPRVATEPLIARFGDYAFEVHARRVTTPSGVVVELWHSLFDLLLVLLRHPRRLLSRERILELLDDDPAQDHLDRKIDMRVQRLRSALRVKQEGRGSLIRTMRGGGYMLDADVTWEGT